MRISKYDVFWTEEGLGYLITFDEGKYKLYTVKENIVKDLLGEQDVDFQFMYTVRCLEQKDYNEFKDYMIYFKSVVIKDLGELSDIKIYKSQDNVFFKYVNGRAVDLYNPKKMKLRAEQLWEDYIDKLRRKQDENTNPK